MARKKVRSLRCPTCRALVLAGSKEFPFCSERCRLIDLGRWLDEGFALPAVPDPEADEPPENAAEGDS
jgi:endogenous inhibitor of DNA gyrase (YacG/DUF329 family)